MTARKTVDPNDPSQWMYVRMIRQANSGEHDATGKPILWPVGFEHKIDRSTGSQLVNANRAVEIKELTKKEPDPKPAEHPKQPEPTIRNR